MDDHDHDVSDHSEDHGDGEPLEEQLPRAAEVQEVWLCWVFLMWVFLRERFPTRSETCQLIWMGLQMKQSEFTQVTVAPDGYYHYVKSQYCEP